MKKKGNVNVELVVLSIAGKNAPFLPHAIHSKVIAQKYHKFPTHSHTVKMTNEINLLEPFRKESCPIYSARQIGKSCVEEGKSHLRCF